MPAQMTAESGADDECAFLFRHSEVVYTYQFPAISWQAEAPAPLALSPANQTFSRPRFGFASQPASQKRAVVAIQADEICKGVIECARQLRRRRRSGAN